MKKRSLCEFRIYLKFYSFYKFAIACKSLKKAYLYLLLFFILALVEVAQAQTGAPSFVNFDNKNGLPSSEVYYSLQDKQGYMWFGTDRGVVRYDGYDFKTFTEEDGLLENVVFELYEDDIGRIWMIGKPNKLCYYYKGKIHAYKYNSRLTDYLNHENRYCISFQIAKSGNILIGTQSKGLLQINEDGDIKRLDNLTHASSGLAVKEDVLCSFHQSRTNKNVNDVIVSHLYYEADTICNIKMNIISRTYGKMGQNGNILIAIGPQLLLYNTKAKRILDQRTFSNRTTSLQEIDGTYYVGLYNNGMHAYAIENNEIKLQSKILKGYTPTSISRDSFGGLWITTTEKGIFYSSSNGIYSLNTDNGLINNYIEMLESDDSNLYIGYQNGFEKYNHASAQSDEILRPYGKVSGHEKRYSRDGCFFKEYNRVIIDICSEIVYPHKNAGVRKVIQSDNTWFVIMSTGYWKVKKDQISYQKIKKKSMGIIESAAIDGDKFYLGTTTGLFVISRDDTINLADESALFRNRIVDIACSKTRGLVVATRGEGVLFYKDGKVTQASKRYNLSTKDIVSLFVDDSDHIWVATNQGLYQLFGESPVKMNHYTTRDGLVSNEITSIERIDNNIYVGTKRGLSIIDLNAHRKNELIPTVEITSVFLDDNKQVNKRHLQLYPDNKSLEVQFLSIDFAGINDLEYKYRIKGLSESWHYTKQRSVRVDNLPEQGTYTIEIYSRIGSNGAWSKKPALQSFTVHPPFYKTGLFQSGVLALFVVLIYLGFKLRIFRYDKHIQQELTDRMLRRLGKKSYLVLEIDKKKLRIDQEEILFIQSFKDYCEIHTISQKYLYRSSLKRMETLLSQLSFIRVHRSYIIRKDKIEVIGKDHLVIGETEIPIGKTYREALKKVKAQFSRVNT